MSALLIVAALAAQTGNAPASPASINAKAQRTTGAGTYVDLELGAGYSSNPNLSIVNDEGSAFGRISVHAVHSRVSALSTTLLSAFAEDVSYTNHHGSHQSVNLYA